MPSNIHKGDNQHPLSAADVELSIIEGIGATAQIQNLIINNPLITGNTISVDVDGVTVSQVFVTNSNTTLAALAVKIAAEAGIATAVVTDAGGGTDDDRVIVITGLGTGAAFILSNDSVTGGASQTKVKTFITTPGSDGLALNSPEYIASTVAGIGNSDRAWQLKKLIYSANGVLKTLFAEFKGRGNSGYRFANEKVSQIQELFFTRGATLLSGNTVSIDVDGITLSQVFVTDHQTTLNALAVKIAAEPDVNTAVRRGDHIIEVTALDGDFDVVLSNAVATGGTVTTVIEIRETQHGQPSTKNLIYS